MPVNSFLFVRALALLLALLGCAAAVAGPVYHQTACPAPDSGYFQDWIECGVAILPEDRNTGTGEVRIPLVRLGPPDSDSVPAIMLGGGGPGGDLYLTSDYGGFDEYRTEILGDDGVLILMDQRGTWSARPFLGCAEEYEAHGSDHDSAYGPMQEVLSPEQQTEREIAALRDCLERLREDGVQVTAYTTAAAADDVEDIRQLLGIEQWHLIGVSYGTRLALEVIRRHPQGVASAVLDSPFPYDAWKTPPFYPAASMLKRVDEQCRQQEDCRLRHGSVVDNITQVLAMAAETPLTANFSAQDEYGGEFTEQVFLTPRDIIGEFTALEDEAVVEKIPSISRELAEGNADALNGLYSGGAGFGIEKEFADMLYEFITCNEGHNEGLLAQAKPASELERHEHAVIQAYADICEGLWGGSGTPPPVVSTDKPVLVISGVYDMRTPPSWGRALARRLPNAQLLLVDGGHNPETPCMLASVYHFLQSPHTPLEWRHCGAEKVSFE